MISTKARENRKMKALKLSKNLERKYKEVKCRECTVVVTPMDFARILGKFTKVKIQYESSSKSKPKQTNIVSQNLKSKTKENGMVRVLRQAYNPHPAQKLLGHKKTLSRASPTLTSNVLKENNRNQKTEKVAYSEQNDRPLIKSKVRYYGVVFDKPRMRQDIKNKTSLQELIYDINKNILPAEGWCIEYFPKDGEPKDDKIYDRIAAELEDLMYNEKTKNSTDVKDSKTDEFPSILDILNENSKDSTTKTIPTGSVNLESSDVEAMLLGNTSPTKSTPMEVDSVTSYIKEANQPTTKPDVLPDAKTEVASTIIDDNPESPSILEEPFQKDNISSTEVTKMSVDNNKNKKVEPSSTSQTNQIDENDNTNSDNKNSASLAGVTQIVFKKSVNGSCDKSVTCPKNLKYSINMLGKSVELIGAPKHISSLEDLQVLLQIVEESDLTNVYVLH